MMNNPSNLHVRLRLVRQLSSLAGTRARLPTVGATFPTPTGHQTTRRFSSSVPLTRLEALFFELAKDEEREFLRLRKGGQQDIIAKQLSDVETDVENVHPYDVADCVTPSVTWGDQEAEVDVPTPVDNVCIDAFEVLDDADMYVGETSSCDSVPHVDPGDPFGCDHIDMLQAKARSRYAWVTCETQFEKYVLQAQGRVYFFIERIHDVENIAYNVGFALANRGDNADQGQRTAINSLALFESRKTVVQARSRDDAFRMADLLIEKMISDEKLLRMLSRTARWRSKAGTLQQLNMLLRMQTAHRNNANNKPQSEPSDRDHELTARALTMTAGEMSCLLCGFLFSHLDPAEETSAYNKHAVKNGPPLLVEITREKR